MLKAGLTRHPNRLKEEYAKRRGSKVDPKVMAINSITESPFTETRKCRRSRHCGNQDLDFGREMNLRHVGEVEKTKAGSQVWNLEEQREPETTASLGPGVRAGGQTKVDRQTEPGASGVGRSEEGRGSGREDWKEQPEMGGGGPRPGSRVRSLGETGGRREKGALRTGPEPAPQTHC